MCIDMIQINNQYSRLHQKNYTQARFRQSQICTATYVCNV